MNKFLFILIWLLSLIIVSIYTYENPEKIEIIKNYFKKDKDAKVKLDKTLIQKVESENKLVQKVIANSFSVEFSKIISLSQRTAFVVHDENILNFDENYLKIYTQDGYLLKNFKSEKLNLPDAFTTEKNGGVKTIFIYNDNEFALISSSQNKFLSSSKNKCFYASIILLTNKKELFKTKCLPDKNIDFNALGSSNIHHNNKIFFSIGAPEQVSSKIAELAQDINSMFGKILEINKNDLDKIVNNLSQEKGRMIDNEENDIKIKIFSSGHRNPQGLTRINESFFSVEHGPRGGDELNKIIKDKNYGWPKVSYGTKYKHDKAEKSYGKSHENNEFEEPLFALVPSVGISALNTCPVKLKKYYKKPCLLALSLWGNSLRPGKSIIIYLLNEKMNKVHSIEKIHLRDDLKLRHFVTNSKNELYEDEEGSIYISADKKGIYKLSFVDFMN